MSQEFGVLLHTVSIWAIPLLIAITFMKLRTHMWHEAVGANLGSAINPVLEGSKSGDPASRRVPIGNLLNRIVGVAAILRSCPRSLKHSLVLSQMRPGRRPNSISPST
jgi:Na+/phosphate symporter